jgi:Terpene synthase family 2, C-terminal metal binding
MHSLVTGSYDWRAIVAENRPGSGSDGQRRRAQLLSQIASELHGWAVCHDLWIRRVKASAYHAVAATALSPDQYREATIVARYLLWIFSLDDHLDRAHLASDPPAPGEIEEQLALSIEPLFDRAGAAREAAAEQGLGWLLGRSAPVTAKMASIRDGLAEIYVDIAAEHFNGSSTPSREFALENFVLQLARMLGTWRDELRDSAARRRGHSMALPGLEEYLRRGAISIGAPPMATVPACFDPDPQAAWRSCEATMHSGGCIARLCNDLSTYEAEVAEMKVNAVKLALAQLGFDPFAPHDLSGPELTSAIEIVQQRLTDEIAFFAQASSVLPDGRLAFWARTNPAFAIAMYEKGNYVEPA